MTLKVNLKKLEYAGSLQTEITNRACTYLQDALNHPEFNKKIHEAEFTASWQRVPGRNDMQLSAQDVALLILQGKEQGTSVDNEIDLHIRFKRKWRAVGSTPLGRFPITTAYWFVNQCISSDDPASLAAHFMHEWMHVAGFYHFGGNEARGDVPYIVGEIVHDVIIENLGLGYSSEMK